MRFNHNNGSAEGNNKTGPSPYCVRFTDKSEPTLYLNARWRGEELVSGSVLAVGHYDIHRYFEGAK